MKKEFIKNKLISIIKLLIIISLILFLINIVMILLVSLKLDKNDSIKNHNVFYRENYNIEEAINAFDYEKEQGIEYKTPGILVFGAGLARCLPYPQDNTFSAKLSRYAKRPVYDRAVGGQGINHAILQVYSHQIDDLIKKSDTAIYLFASFHDTDRLYGYPGPIFQPGFLYDKYMYPVLQYHENARFECRRTSIPFIKGSVLYRIIQKIFNNIKYKIFNEKTQQEDANIYFEELQKSLKQVNPKIKFYVVFYWEEENFNDDKTDINYLFTKSIIGYKPPVEDPSDEILEEFVPKLYDYIQKVDKGNNI